MTPPIDTSYRMIAKAIRAKLLTSSDLVALITQNAVEPSDFVGIKTFLGAAPGNANLPYIRYHHVYGGEPAKAPSRELDQLWLVTSVAFDQPIAMDIDAYAQSLLLGQRLTFTNGWQSWADLTKNGEYYNVTNIQGQEAWEIGAYYRIRGVKGT